MFTSRSEDRLSLRQDTADQRLTPRGYEAGLVPTERWAVFRAKLETIERARSLAKATRMNGAALESLMKRPDFNLHLVPEDVRALTDNEIWELVETDLKYDGYVKRQASQNRHIASRERQPIPDGLDLSQIPGLKPETRQKLTRVRPATLGDAQRVSGVTPADVSIISIWLSKNAP